MANPVNEKGYQIMTTGKVVQTLGAANPRQVVGLMHWLNAPKGFSPGKNDDARQGYGIGSQIISKDKNIFTCLDCSEGKAVWMRTKGVVTHGSYDESAEPVEEKAEPAAEETIDELTEEDVRESIKKTTKAITDHEKEEKATHKKGEAADAPELETGIDLSDIAFEGLPYRKFIMESNGIQTLPELKEVIKAGTLTEKKHMNKARAKKIVDYLKLNSFIQ